MIVNDHQLKITESVLLSFLEAYIRLEEEYALATHGAKHRLIHNIQVSSLLSVIAELADDIKIYKFGSVAEMD